MKKFLLKTLIVSFLFSFTGFRNFNDNFKPISVSASIVENLGNPIVYYTDKGKSFHLSKSCSRLSNSKSVRSGKLSDVLSLKGDSCDICVGDIISSKPNINNNNNSSSNISSKLNADKGELKKYLENAYKKAFLRNVDEEGLNYWINELSQGKVSIRDFILNVLGSDEFNNLNLNEKERIHRIYGVMFLRDAEEEGLNYWMGKLNENLKNNNSKNALVITVKEMMKSDELLHISKKIGILY